MPSKDGALVATADPELSVATDVASRPPFADRRQAREIDGPARLGWFVHDFTLAELKTLARTAPAGARLESTTPGCATRLRSKTSTTAPRGASTAHYSKR